MVKSLGGVRGGRIESFGWVKSGLGGGGRVVGEFRVVWRDWME